MEAVLPKHVIRKKVINLYRLQPFLQTLVRTQIHIFQCLLRFIWRNNILCKRFEIKRIIIQYWQQSENSFLSSSYQNKKIRIYSASYSAFVLSKNGLATLRNFSYYMDKTLNTELKNVDIRSQKILYGKNNKSKSNLCYRI